MTEFELPALDTQWKREFAEMITKLHGDALFDQTMDEQQPDSWDGCYTKQQRWKAQLSMRFLIYKLKENGFLTADYKP